MTKHFNASFCGQVRLSDISPHSLDALNFVIIEMNFVIIKIKVKKDIIIIILNIFIYHKQKM